MVEFMFRKCLDIDGLYMVEPQMFSDERGYNFEAYNAQEFKKAGLDMDFVQQNRSMSCKCMLRGLHSQKTYQQGKLVSIISGEVFDVAVDIREGSKTYGRWSGVVLSAENYSFGER